jgi:hypothetical protein
MEIVYSIRSWRKYFQHKHEIVVIGNYKKPNIECDRFIYFKQNCPSTHENTSRIMRYAIDNFDQFIWSNDDIYLLSPAKLEDIKVVYHGKDEFIYENDPWCKLLHNTVVLLKNNNKSQKNGETHTPYFYESQKVRQILDNYPVEKGECLLRTAYINTFCEAKNMVNAEIDAVYFYKQDYSPEQLKNKKFLNHDDKGLTEDLKRLIGDLFSR